MFGLVCFKIEIVNEILAFITNIYLQNQAFYYNPKAKIEIHFLATLGFSEPFEKQKGKLCYLPPLYPISPVLLQQNTIQHFHISFRNQFNLNKYGIENI